MNKTNCKCKIIVSDGFCWTAAGLQLVIFSWCFSNYPGVSRYSFEPLHIYRRMCKSLRLFTIFGKPVIFVLVWPQPKRLMCDECHDYHWNVNFLWCAVFLQVCILLRLPSPIMPWILATSSIWEQNILIGFRISTLHGTATMSITRFKSITDLGSPNGRHQSNAQFQKRWFLAVIWRLMSHDESFENLVRLPTTEKYLPAKLGSPAHHG